MDKKCKNKKMFITTPIYYVNDVPHIGHAYTTIIADTIARYSKLSGYETFFLTGTDEHGQKIEQSAKKKNKTPKEYADEISNKFKSLWDSFGISYDKFIRTTDKYHKIGVQKAFLKMYEKGDIYKGEYEGNYCISCESFFNERDLLDSEYCPDCGKATTIVKEESYFFKLSKYQDKLLKLYKEKDDFILPKSKAKEIINFVQNGLEDLSISRTSFDWGVKLPKELNDTKHVMYVWLDALLNYITALGYENDEKNLMEFWPAKVQIVGKDILKFHAIYWPAFLMSLELPLPSHIAAHGWWTIDGQKMSKSKGNVIDPQKVADEFGLDQFRYFLLREVPFGQDGDFGYKAMVNRINNELGNDLGNLLNRIIGMSGKYFNFKIDSNNIDICKQLLDEVDKKIETLPNLIYNMQLNRYLEEIWKILNIANKAIGDFEPWNLIKNNKTNEAMGLVSFIANVMGRVMLLLYPIMPQKMELVSKSIGVNIDSDNFTDLIENKNIIQNFTITKVEQLFPKIDEKEIIKNKIETNQENKKNSGKTENIITIDEFFKSQIKVGTIIEIKDIKKSKKLYLLKIDLGEDKPREVVAGIKEYYKENELLNKQVCVVSNLKKAKIMGYESNGMILASKDKNRLSLIVPDSLKENGSLIS